MSNKQNEQFFETLKERVDELGYKISSRKELLNALREKYRKVRDYEYTAQLKDKETGDVLARVSSHSLEGLEMELNKLKEKE